MNVTETWDAYKVWLTENEPDLLDGLADGASCDQIERFEQFLGKDLPADYRDFISQHNGQNEAYIGTFFGDDLLSIEDATELISELMGDVPTGLAIPPSHPPGAVKDVWWSRGWVPFAADGFGNYYVLDLDPGPEGCEGQVFFLDHEGWVRSIEAPSLEEHFHQRLEEARAGRMGHCDQTGRLVRSPKQLYDTLAVQLNIDQYDLPGGADFDWSEDHVKSVIIQAMATTKQELEDPIQFREFDKSVLSHGKSWSTAAYIESTEGYFFVVEALADHITVVYNR